MENANTEKLKLVLEKYGVPDPKIVGKLPKGGTQLDYVSHSRNGRTIQHRHLFNAPKAQQVVSHRRLRK